MLASLTVPDPEVPVSSITRPLPYFCCHVRITEGNDLFLEVKLWVILIVGPLVLSLTYGRYSPNAFDE